MDLKSKLLSSASKRNILAVVDYVGSDAGRFNELIKLLLSDEYRVVQRASWAVSVVIEREPHLIERHLKRMLAILDEEATHPSVHRNVLRIFQIAPIPDRMAGKLYDICLAKIEDVAAPVAVRACAIEVGVRIAAGDRDLLNEIRQVTKRHLKGAKPAKRVKARNLLNLEEKHAEEAEFIGY